MSPFLAHRLLLLDLTFLLTFALVSPLGFTASRLIFLSIFSCFLYMPHPHMVANLEPATPFYLGAPWLLSSRPQCSTLNDIKWLSSSPFSLAGLKDGLLPYGMFNLHAALTSIISEMRQVFDRAYTGRQSEKLIHQLCQSSCSMYDYGIKFRMLMASCGWDDRALCDTFVNSLDEYVKDELVSHELPEHLCDIMDHAGRIDHHL